MYRQRDYVRDYIFPLVTAQKYTGGYTYKEFLGSGFLFGNNGFALTAAHVIGHVINRANTSPNDTVVVMFVAEDEKWYAFEVLQAELHPTEDVAILKIDGAPWKSPFRMRNKWEGSSAKYHMFGYPEDAVGDLINPEEGRIIPRPDLVYNAGYIRRRLSFNPGIPRVKGENFFELSEIAGVGCSGSPLYILNKRVWDVIGIYVGEKINYRGTSVSYGVREDAFRDWTPLILGTSILEESQNYSV